MRLRVDLGYDGGPFHGFARQPDVRTVQGVLEDALSRVLGQDVTLTCAGRTDAGVHALEQVVHLDLDPHVPAAARVVRDLDDLGDRLDKMSGPAIAVWRVAQVADDFHARFSAVERRYRYRIVDAPRMHPLDRYRAWHVPGPLDLDRMRAGAAHVLGEHDFSAFCRKPSNGHNVRRLDEIDISRPDTDQVHARLRGPAFCHQQVRSVIGCLVEVGLGRRDPDWVAEVRDSRDRSRAPMIAPPEGLALERVVYDDG